MSWGLDETLAHLGAGLSGDAQAVWQEFFAVRAPKSGVAKADLHDVAHQAVARVHRVLRSSRSEPALHAAGVAFASGRGLLLPGPSLAGKSTLALTLAAKVPGAVVADDHLWLEGPLMRGIGAPVSIRAGSPVWDQVRDLPYGHHADRVMVRPTDLGLAEASAACSIDAIVLGRRVAGEGEAIHELSAAETYCCLIGNARSALTKSDVRGLAHLAAGVPAVKVRYGEASSIVDALMQHVESSAPPPTKAPDFLEPEELRRLGFNSQVYGVRFGEAVVLTALMHGLTLHLERWPDREAEQNIALELEDSGFGWRGQLSA